MKNYLFTGTYCTNDDLTDRIKILTLEVPIELVDGVKLWEVNSEEPTSYWYAEMNELLKDRFGDLTWSEWQFEEV